MSTQEQTIETIKHRLAQTPYASYLGIEVEGKDDELMFVLPTKHELLGNVTLPAIHGGVIGAFMEQAAAQFFMHAVSSATPLTVINFSIDYLRAARQRTTFANCSLTRQGAQVAHVSIAAWQEACEKPIAIARVHFLLGS